MPNRSRLDDQAATSFSGRDLGTRELPTPDHPADARTLSPWVLAAQLSPSRSTPHAGTKVVGRFHYGTLVGNDFQILATWRLSSDHFVSSTMPPNSSTCSRTHLVPSPAATSWTWQWLALASAAPW